MTDENKAFLLRVADALESGAYKQGTGWLFHKRRGTHCCLGVACDIDPDIAWGGLDLQAGWIAEGLQRDAQWPPGRADGRWGLTPHEIWMLGSANDAGATFPEIAQAIREHVLGEEPLDYWYYSDERAWVDE